MIGTIRLNKITYGLSFVTGLATLVVGIIFFAFICRDGVWRGIIDSKSITNMDQFLSLGLTVIGLGLGLGSLLLFSLILSWTRTQNSILLPALTIMMILFVIAANFILAIAQNETLHLLDTTGYGLPLFSWLSSTWVWVVLILQTLILVVNLATNIIVATPQARRFRINANI